MSPRERLILLNLVPGVGSTRLRRLLDHFGDLDRLWQAREPDLQRVAGIGPAIARQLAAGRDNAPALRRELELAQRHGVTIVTLEDAEYPGALRHIPDPPLALYTRGRLPAQEEPAVAVVGARHASLYGTQCAERLAYELALRGVTIVSGLARGIDGAAHRGALKAGLPAPPGGGAQAGGRTVAVLGNGLSRIYPPEHDSLAAQIAQAGAIISEYPMEMAPLSQNFPRRNRVISGLSLGVVVVEAGRRSGALITADCALEQGREVFAVPGPITTTASQGSHGLLKQGARLVTSVEDVLDELRLSVRAEAQTRLTAAPAPAMISPSSAGARTRLDGPEQRIVACLSDRRPMGIDAIASEARLEIPEVSSLLLRLELKQVIRQLPGKRFIRAAPAP